MKKKTVGQKATELYCKIPDTLNAYELTQEQLTEYDKNVQECYQRGIKLYPNTDFYIVVLVKWEQVLGHKVLHPLFLPRRTCATPEWDQTVYRCHKESGEIEFLWTLPSKQACENYITNQTVIPPEEWGILNFVLKDKNGDLLKLAKKLNSET